MGYTCNFCKFSALNALYDDNIFFYEIDTVNMEEESMNTSHRFKIKTKTNSM